MDQSLMTFVVLMGAVILRIGLVLCVIWVLIPSRRDCPFCSTPVERVVTNKLIRGLRMEWKWCLGCGWEGLSKSKRGPLQNRSLLRHLPDNSQRWSVDHFSAGTEPNHYRDRYSPETESE